MMVEILIGRQKLNALIRQANHLKRLHNIEPIVFVSFFYDRIFEIILNSDYLFKTYRFSNQNYLIMFKKQPRYNDLIG